MSQATGTDNFSTYQRGPNCINYALCDYHVTRALTMGCYEPFQYHTKGDHHAMAFDFSTTLLFGNMTHQLHTPTTHGFKSTDRQAVRKYIAARHEYIVNHKYEECLQDLQNKVESKRG